jgi:histidinol phosphatase-like PHP family hydrolase
VLNEEGDVCLENQKIEGNFTILSVHRNSYQSQHNTATKGLLNAIERYHDKIHLIGHPYDRRQLGEYIDIKEVVELANMYHIPIEFNH